MLGPGGYFTAGAIQGLSRFLQYQKPITPQRLSATKKCHINCRRLLVYFVIYFTVKFAIFMNVWTIQYGK